MRCDTHILNYRGNVHWLEDALDSVKNEPTRVHLIDVDAHIGKARAHALTLGTAPYVSWLDDDDRFLPGVMAQCIAYLDEHPACVGVYTDRTLLYSDGSITEWRLDPWCPYQQLCSPKLITHMKVMRRSHVEQHLDELTRWPTYEEYVLCALLAAQGPWHHLPVLGCVKRTRRPGEALQKGDSMTLDTPGLLQRAVARVAPGVLARWPRTQLPTARSLMVDSKRVWPA
jgi:hypothetical protein